MFGKKRLHIKNKEDILSFRVSQSISREIVPQLILFSLFHSAFELPELDQLVSHGEMLGLLVSFLLRMVSVSSRSVLVCWSLSPFVHSFVTSLDIPRQIYSL